MADRNGKSVRGFASMDANKQKEIASKGGKAAHAKGTAHQFNSEEAREAGRKGGQTVSRNREHMANIGREGGKNSRPGRGADEHDGDEHHLAAEGGSDAGDIMRDPGGSHDRMD